VDKACRKHGRDQKYIQNFSREDLKGREVILASLKGDVQSSEKYGVRRLNHVNLASFSSIES
jgi:hypothetical protein